jgi:hypothetical protein
MFLRLAYAVPLAVLVPLLIGEAPSERPLPLERAAPRGYVCYRTERPPRLTGKIDDPVWQAAPWSEDFVDIEGDKKPKPPYRTRVKMLWDDQALYIAAELEEPHVWAAQTEHDSVIFLDPDFEVFLDPDGDNHNYGELELNARNTTWDLLLTKPYRDRGRAIHAWEILGLKTAVHVNGTLNDPRDKDVGWTVEIVWPWGGLKELVREGVPPKDGDVYRINFSRVEWDFDIVDGKYVKIKGRDEHNWVWSPQGAIDMHRPERWGYLQFSTKVRGPVPYIPDPDQGIKDVLHDLYYAQRDYHKKNGTYAKNPTDLGLKKTPLGVPEIETTRHGFEATLSGKKKWCITQDSRIWVDDK